MNDFKTFVDNIILNRPLIVLTKEDTDKVDEAITHIIREKNKESEYNQDSGKIIDRFRTGLYGEIAIEKLFNMDDNFNKNYVDLTAGATNKYHSPDLNNAEVYNVGVKTSDYFKNNCIIFNPRITTGQVINVRINNIVIILGYVNRETLIKYSDNSLVKSINARTKSINNKTGFYGYDYIIPFNNRQELINISKG